MTATLSDREIAAPAPLNKPRYYTIDLAKGVGILLVVFGHIWRGVDKAGLLSSPQLFDAVDRWIYAFHMPLFFFISGLFIARSADKSGREFFADKFAGIAYPYVLWSLIHGAMLMAFPKSGDRPEGWKGLADQIFINPEHTQFWFLYVLLLCSILFFLLRRAGLTVPMIAVFAIALFVVKNIWGFGLVSIHGKEFGFLYQLADEFVIFTAGACLAKPTLNWLAAPGLAMPMVAGAGLVVLTVVVRTRWPPDYAARFLIAAAAIVWAT